MLDDIDILKLIQKVRRTASNLSNEDFLSLVTTALNSDQSNLKAKFTPLEKPVEVMALKNFSVKDPDGSVSQRFLIELVKEGAWPLSDSHAQDLRTARKLEKQLVSPM